MSMMEKIIAMGPVLLTRGLFFKWRWVPALFYISFRGKGEARLRRLPLRCPIALA